MAEESPNGERRSAQGERRTLMGLVGLGLVASAIGIVLGLLIDWFPVQASSQASTVDTVYDVLIFASTPIFVLVTTIILYCVWKFRVRPGEEDRDGPPVHGNTRLEVIWTALPALMLIALCTYAYVALRDIEEAQAGEQTINVIGQQFAWTFEYPQGDGEPIRSNQLYLAEGQPVRFSVRSLDVIHDFWVPAFRMKVDAVPGVTTRYRVTPTRRGSYPVVCAELCGLGHAFMRQSANVVSQENFARWLANKREEATGGGATAGADGQPDGKALFVEGNGEATACGACHTLQEAGTSATTGPDLDEALAGEDPEAIRRAIVEPNAEIAEGFSEGIMPPNYGMTLSNEELDALVTYLARVTE